MSNLDDLKIPVFSGINDIPTAPTATKGGNGSHLVATINSLIDRLSEQPSFSGDSRWIRIIAGELLQVNTKYLLMIGGDGVTTINPSLPQNPIPGDFVTLLKADSQISAEIYYSYSIQGDSGKKVTIDKTNEEITLIYTGDAMGWVPSRSDVLLFEVQPL